MTPSAFFHRGFLNLAYFLSKLSAWNMYQVAAGAWFNLVHNWIDQTVGHWLWVSMTAGKEIALMMNSIHLLGRYTFSASAVDPWGTPPSSHLCSLSSRPFSLLSVTAGCFTGVCRSGVTTICRCRPRARGNCQELIGLYHVKRFSSTKLLHGCLVSDRVNSGGAEWAAPLSVPMHSCHTASTVFPLFSRSAREPACTP